MRVGPDKPEEFGIGQVLRRLHLAQLDVAAQRPELKTVPGEIQPGGRSTARLCSGRRPGFRGRIEHAGAKERGVPAVHDRVSQHWTLSLPGPRRTVANQGEAVAGTTTSLNVGDGSGGLGLGDERQLPWVSKAARIGSAGALGGGPGGRVAGSTAGCAVRREWPAARPWRRGRRGGRFRGRRGNRLAMNGGGLVSPSSTGGRLVGDRPGEARAQRAGVRHARHVIFGALNSSSRS